MPATGGGAGAGGAGGAAGAAPGLEPVGTGGGGGAAGASLRVKSSFNRCNSSTCYTVSFLADMLRWEMDIQDQQTEQGEEEVGVGEEEAEQPLGTVRPNLGLVLA